MAKREPAQRGSQTLPVIVPEQIDRFPDDFMFQLTSDEWAVVGPQTRGRRVPARV